MSPQRAWLRVPGHSKLCEQNMGWEASQAGAVPGGSPIPSHGGAGGRVALPSSGTSWEQSMHCRECCPYKSPGDTAPSHLPRSLGRVPRGDRPPRLSEPGPGRSAVGRGAGTSTCTVLFNSANTFKATVALNYP